MRAVRIATVVGLAALAWLPAPPSRAADPAPAVAGPPGSAGLVVGGPGGEVTLSAEALAALPVVAVAVPAGSGPDARGRTFEGPLLWGVLVQARAVDPAKHQGDVRGTVVLTGQDGYTAVIALGELSPEFENKPVILAVRADGQALDAGHFRVVVPGDKRGGRGVRDVARIELVTGPAASR